MIALGALTPEHEVVLIVAAAAGFCDGGGNDFNHSSLLIKYLRKNQLEIVPVKTEKPCL